MKNAITFITRRCPRECDYCAIRDAKGIGPELTADQWKEAFSIYADLGVNFNLILGNEPWLLGDRLIDIFKDTKVPYAIYTTCPEPLFSKYREKMFDTIDNLSCGLDFPSSYLEEQLRCQGGVFNDDIEQKSWAAWQGFKWVKEHRPDVDCHAAITMHKKNLAYIPELIDELSAMGIFSILNVVHWNIDGKYDFFPKKEELQELVIPDTPEMVEYVQKMFDKILEKPGLLQNPEMLRMPVADMLGLKWHCKGDPTGGPNVDSDGRLRVCGYRRGTETPKLSIFDLPEHLDEWKAAVEADAEECPGCAWSCSWMYQYWNREDEVLGKKVFRQHAGKHIPEEKWSKRRV